MNEAVLLLARTEGLLLDPVYSGKALAGLVDLIRNGEFSSAVALVRSVVSRFAEEDRSVDFLCAVQVVTPNEAAPPAASRLVALVPSVVSRFAAENRSVAFPCAVQVGTQKATDRCAVVQGAVNRRSVALIGFQSVAAHSRVMVSSAQVA
jgi:hypothetical protein